MTDYELWKDGCWHMRHEGQVHKGVPAIAKHVGLPYGTVSRRLQYGIDLFISEAEARHLGALRKKPPRKKPVPKQVAPAEISRLLAGWR